MRTSFLAFALTAGWVGAAGCAVADERPVFEKLEWWGPCPAEAVCRQTTTLFASGLLTIEGKDRQAWQLGQPAAARIIERLRASGAMEQPCTAEPRMDSWAQYTLRLDQKERVIQFPGCEQELRAIDELIAQAAKDTAPRLPVPATH